MSGQFFGRSGANQTILAVVVSTIIVFFLDPLKRLFARVTDRVFFKSAINYDEVLLRVNEIISAKYELQDLLRSTTQYLRDVLKVQHCYVLLANKSGKHFRSVAAGQAQNVSVTNKDEMIRYLSRTNEFFLKRVVVRDELERRVSEARNDRERSELGRSLATVEQLQAGSVVPLTTQRRLTGVLVFGSKLSGDVFGQADLEFFQSFAPALATAVEKAKLYEEVRGFTEKLKLEVARATEDLRIRNVYLNALQRMTSLVTRTLDYQRATQSIVDGIANELGYIGGILIMYDKVTGDTWAEAITETRLTRTAIKLLPKPVTAYRGSIRDQSLTIEAIKSGEIQEGDKFSDFVSPALPRSLAAAIQKITGIKYTFAIPIVSEEEVIGTMIVNLAKPKSEVSSQEVAMMKSLADQTGIVVRNLRLYEQIRKANEDLARANERLSELDQAKSEFISIASHQLRTPMAGIMGYLSMVQQGDFGSITGELKGVVDQLLDQSRRMIRLINQFLDISRIEAGRFVITKRQTKLEELIRSVIFELKKLAEEKGLRVEFTNPKTALPPVIVDPDKIKDVALNLIDNAIKYTEKGKVTVIAKRAGAEVAVAVVDTGVGIDSKDASNLFSKFVRGEGIARIQPGGSGLGLFIAKKIVEAHGGRIWVESRGKGKGSTFTFTLPIG